MTLILGVFNQAIYPGAGDTDDCSVVATVQAVLAANPGARKPSVPVFREAAGEPDRQGQADGLNLSQIIAAVRTIWPDVRVRAFRAAPWEQFATTLYSGGVASLAVRSGDLPSAHRYGFAGLHQVAVEYDHGWYLANPLAPNGSAPKRITEQALRKAINGYSNVGVYAAYFPQEDPMIAANIERWLLNGKPVTTIGTPIVAGKPDFSRRYAFFTDRGGANPRFDLVDRAKLTPYGDWKEGDELEAGLAAFFYPDARKTVRQEFAAEIVKLA